MHKTMTEKFLQSVWVTVVARATLLAMPFVVSFVTWITLNVYTRIESAIERQETQIIEIQKQILDHEFRLTAGKAARLEFQANATAQYQRFDAQLAEIADKITETNNAVIRVQTIIETRLPAKEGRNSWPQQ